VCTWAYTILYNENVKHYIKRTMGILLVSVLAKKGKNMNNDDDFDFAEYEKAVMEDPLYPVEECIKMLEETSEFNIIGLYDSIDNCLFQDINYGMVVSMMPKWVADEGISPEGCCTKDFYDTQKRKAFHPVFGRFIYHYELWSIIAGIQERLSAVKMFLRLFYKEVPCKAKYTPDQYTSGSRQGGDRETQAHVLLNSIFVAYASIFDLLAKVAVEENQLDGYDFGKYKEMKSNWILYKYSLKNISPSLQAPGMLFSDPLIVKKFVTFRNEYVHNGPWDLRSSVYYTAVNGELADVVIYSPDMDEHGNFVKSGSRNKFYSQNNRINIQLPDMIKEATSILQSTIDELSRLYQLKTTKKEDTALTEEYMKAIADYYKSLV